MDAVGHPFGAMGDMPPKQVGDETALRTPRTPGSCELSLRRLLSGLACGLAATLFKTR
jgi:hypothetical protein